MRRARTPAMQCEKPYLSMNLPLIAPGDYRLEVLLPPFLPIAVGRCCCTAGYGLGLVDGGFFERLTAAVHGEFGRTHGAAEGGEGLSGGWELELC